ncbi:MAG: plasmid partition protein ParG [Thiolinea sp.]|mgnify:CR=1 FL=1
MAKKKFSTAPKPGNQLSQNEIEAFEQGGVGQDKKPQNHKTTNAGKTKRLSIDLPEDTHTRFKVVCSANGLRMTKEVENFILARCAELENNE